MEQSEAVALSSASIEPHSQHGHTEGGTLFPCPAQVQLGWGRGPGLLEHCVIASAAPFLLLALMSFPFDN